MDYIRIRNWEKFQHYKHRNPPWIKLYIELLDDFRFLGLSDIERAQLLSIWILAGRLNNKIPNDEEFIRNRTGLKSEINIHKFIELEFIEFTYLGTEKNSEHSSALLQRRDREETEKRREEPFFLKKVKNESEEAFDSIMDFLKKYGRTAYPDLEERASKTLKAIGGYSDLCNIPSDQVVWKKKAFMAKYKEV